MKWSIVEQYSYHHIFDLVAADYVLLVSRRETRERGWGIHFLYAYKL